MASIDDFIHEDSDSANGYDLFVDSYWNFMVASRYIDQNSLCFVPCSVCGRFCVFFYYHSGPPALIALLVRPAGRLFDEAGVFLCKICPNNPSPWLPDVLYHMLLEYCLINAIGMHRCPAPSKLKDCFLVVLADIGIVIGAASGIADVLGKFLSRRVTSIMNSLRSIQQYPNNQVSIIAMKNFFKALHVRRNVLLAQLANSIPFVIWPKVARLSICRIGFDCFERVISGVNLLVCRSVYHVVRYMLVVGVHYVVDVDFFV